MQKKQIKTYFDLLEKIYDQFNHFKYIHPDPLEFIYKYKNPNDMELVGFIAAGFAYGRVNSILKAVDEVLKVLGENPSEKLKDYKLNQLIDLFKNFKYRFTTGEEVAKYLFALGLTLKKFETLENCFLSFYKDSQKTIEPALTGFVDYIYKQAGFQKCTLIPDPKRGSSCKRLHLFLRWMVRKDNVDAGIWKLPSAKLIIPLDTHMFKVSKLLGFSSKKAANLRTAIEITNQFKLINPEDPVKYDFSLTRFGINPNMNYSELNALLPSNI
jgi:uncharacterized protein (TIGR02757 family)